MPMVAPKGVVCSMKDVDELLLALANTRTFDVRHSGGHLCAQQWREGERTQWLGSLELTAGDTFAQQLIDALAAEAAKLLLQHRNPRQVSKKWWSHHIEPICWFMEALAANSTGHLGPHLPITTSVEFA